MKKYPIVIIGAGAGGLVVAIGAAKAGKKVLLIEKGNYGGDCTNFGCVPSKSLIAASHAAHAIASCSQYGIEIETGKIDAKGALKRTRDIVKSIREHEEPEALLKHGVETLTGSAAFQDPHTLQVTLKGGATETVYADQIVIATGSHPFIPPILGIDQVPYLTNETLFDLETIPESLGVIGGGPIGCELAQAFQRLGAQVTLIQHSPHLLKREEPEAQQVLEETFRKEGIALFLGYEPTQATFKEGNIHLAFKCKKKGTEEKLVVSHLLIASGRKPNYETLNLDTIGAQTTPRGIIVDAYGRLPNHKHIFAIGDVAGHAIFTHVAENEGRAVLTNILLPRLFHRKEDRKQAIPRVTYTDPEVASIGLREEEAIASYGEQALAIYHIPFSELDRAITTGRTEGLAKIVTKKWSSKILGCTLVGPRAGDMLSEISVAMRHKIPLRKLAGLIHPYPTYSLAIRKTADQWLTKTLLPTLKKLVGKA